jgi:pimeloyl-ACP methyl ester carboxylesterase
MTLTVRRSVSVGHHPLVHRSPQSGAARRGGEDRLGSRIRSLSREERIFVGCLAIIAIHLAVVALVFPGDADALLRVGLLLVAVVGPAVLAALFVGHGRVVRGLLAALIGLGATVVGLATSVPHAVLAGLGGADVTGILATAAGIVLVVLAFWIALHARRLAVKLAVAIPACFVIAQWLIAPAINAGIATHAPRAAVASASTLGLPGARDVKFPARDGTRLSGWYVPGLTGAAVILLHGSHGTRTDTVAHLRMLAADGYGVLAFDARGHGLSSGETNALGWRGTDDLAGAVSFLDHQPGIDSHRIATLGLSMGAEEALRATAGGIPLRAVVADGAGASTLGDQQIVTHGLGPVFVSETWLTMRAIELGSGQTEPPPLKTVVGHIHVPVLLIASNAADERAIDNIYRQRIGSGATLWYLPDTSHTNGLATHPRAYPARVSRFLNTALAQR